MTFLTNIFEQLQYVEASAKPFQNVKISKFVVDSRKAGKDDIFIALEGLRVDGHNYLSEAAQKGAAVAIVNKNYTGDCFGLNLIKVANPLESLQLLAKNKIQSLQAKIVAITGSVGKTMSKGFLSDLLRPHFKIMSTPGNQNSQIGLPLAILNEVIGDEEILVLEMGMSNSGEIRKLVEIAPPDIAMITHIDKVHIANFNSIDEIIFEKSEILSHPKTTFAVYPDNINGIHFFSKKGTCEKYCYSFESNLGVKLLSDSRVLFHQKHVLKNLLGAIVVAEKLGCNYESLAEQFTTLSLPDMRLTKIEKNGITFINDAYNACVSSVKAAIDSLPCGNRKIAVLGGMAELGKYSESAHMEIGEYSLGKLDSVFCLGEDCLPIFERRKAALADVEYHNEMEEMIDSLKLNLRKGDVVLVKGSCSKQMWKIIDRVAT